MSMVMRYENLLIIGVMNDLYLKKFDVE